MPWISHPASGRLRLQAIQTTLGMLSTPTGKLGGIQAVAAQPRTLLTTRQSTRFGQQAQLLGRAEATTCALLKPWIGGDSALGMA
jgi:hypothetical protein